MASSHRSLDASHRGVLGKKNIPTSKIAAGTICTPQGILKAPSDWKALSAPGPIFEAPYWTKYWMKIPQVIAHCWRVTTRPRISLGAISAW